MEYNINNENLSKVLLYIKKSFQENIKTINQLLEVDYKYSKTKITLECLKDILDRLKDEKVKIQKEQLIQIIYNGDPYITLNLSILAILTKTVIFLDCNDYMFGINNFIVKTVNDALNKFKTNKLIYLCDKNIQEENDLDKIICIDDINKYNAYLRRDNKQARFYSFNYIDFYKDTDEFEEITELIYQYAEENQILIESYSELEPKEAASMIQNGIGNKVVVLTNNEETKQIFKNNLNNKKMYINQNPFKQQINLINKEIFYI